MRREIGRRDFVSVGLSVLAAVAGAGPGAGAAQTSLPAPRTATEHDLPPGPHLTDAELFDALDLSGEMAAAKRAAETKDWNAAKRALADYLRARVSVPWRFDPHNVDRAIVHNKAAADKTVAGEIRVVSVWHTFPGGEIDWFFNATRDRPGTAYDPQWQLQMGRFSFWNELGKTYQATGDERYAQAFVRQLRGWVRQCPLPGQSENNKVGHSAWLTLDVGLCLAYAWPTAFHRFLHSPSFTSEDIALYLKSCIEQGRFLRRFATTGNWLTMEMNGLYTLGAVFPELKEAGPWRAFAAQKPHAELTDQFLPDGAQIELTPGYHNIALDNILSLADVARIVGRAGELPADYLARTERAFDYDLFLSAPDRTLPRLNDSWAAPVPGQMARASVLFPGRADFAWMASGGTKGAPPARTSHAFPYAGYFVMRSDWGTEANYLVFDAGPLGYGHVHQDKLNVALWAWGRELLLDNGGGNYEESKWRKWAVDTFSHNTALVDGKPQRRQTKDRAANVSRVPVAARWTSTPAHDFAQGVYDEGYGAVDDRPVVHTRSVLFVKPDVFVVFDTLAPKSKVDGESHRYEVRWHLPTTATQQERATGIVCTVDAGRPNLVLVPLRTSGREVRSVSAQAEPELLGWDVRKGKIPQVVPATTVVHARAGAGAQQLITLLLPLKAGADGPVRSVEATTTGGARVHLIDGRIFHVEPNRFSETLAGNKPGRQATFAP